VPGVKVKTKELHPGDKEHSEVAGVVHAMMMAVPRDTDNSTLVTALLTAFCEAARMCGMSAEVARHCVSLNFDRNPTGN
jgi:hypothetical protein